MEKSPFFSIIMASYNVEAYIGEAIESIISQTFKDWELIIIDDASTDGTLEKVRRYIDKGEIRIIQSSVNSGGCFVPREIGAKKARGKYIVHLDADDIIGPQFLLQIYKILAIEKADLILPEMWRFENNLESSYKILPVSNFDTVTKWKGKDLVKYTLQGWKIPVAGFAVKRGIFLAAIEEVKKVTSEFHLADEFLSRYMLLISETVNFSNSRYYYRITPSSVTSNKFEEAKRLNLVLNQMCYFTENYFKKESEEYWLSKLDSFFYIFSLYQVYNISTLSFSQKEEILSLIKENRNKLNFIDYKGKVSRHYYISMKLPLKWSMRSYKAIEFLRKFKHKNK